MSKYDSAGLAMIPSGYKASKVYSLIPNSSDGDFDFARSSSATRVNKDGLIEVVQTNVPRLDYPLIDGVVQDTPSLLLEPQRTNVFLQSNQFDTSWTKSNITISSGEIGVAGGLGAWKITANSGSGDKKLIQAPSISGSTMVSVYAKAGTRDYVYLRGVTSGTNKRVYFNLSNGTVGTNEGLSADIVNMGNGWYRCIAQIDQQSGFEFYIGIAENDNEAFYTDDGTGTIYVQYAQAEAGSYATSYIPTAGSTVTRAAETCNGAGTSADFNDSEGVLFVESKWFAVSTTIYHNISNGTNNERVLIYSTDPENIRAIITSGGSNIYAPNVTANSRDFNKVAFKYSTSNRALWVNGFKLASESGTKTMPTGLNTCGFDAGASGGFDGKNNQFITFKQALTDAELEDLTSWDSFSEMAEAQQYQTV